MVEREEIGLGRVTYFPPENWVSYDHLFFSPSTHLSLFGHGTQQNQKPTRLRYLSLGIENATLSTLDGAILVRPTKPRRFSTMTTTAQKPTIVDRLWDVFVHTWDLGFTSFGGPPTHFQIFHLRFVEKYKWLSEQSVCPSLYKCFLCPLMLKECVYGLVPRSLCAEPIITRP